MDSSLLVKLTLVGIGMFQKQAHDAAKAEHVRKIYIKPLQIVETRKPGFPYAKAAHDSTIGMQRNPCSFSRYALSQSIWHQYEWPSAISGHVTVYSPRFHSIGLGPKMLYVSLYQNLHACLQSLSFKVSTSSSGDGSS